MKTIPFVKIHGIGNDFIILDNDDIPGESLSCEFIRAVSNRKTGVGADQVLHVHRREEVNGIVRMRIFNMDGSEVEMCGNGVRSVAHYVFMKIKRGIRSLLAESTLNLHIETLGGTVSAAVESTGQATHIVKVIVDMGVPKIRFEEQHLNPKLAHALGGNRVYASAPMPLPAWEILLPQLQTVCSSLLTPDDRPEMYFVNMGNPHCVVFLNISASQLDQIDIAVCGRALETHEWFPRKTNVEFASAIETGDEDVFQRTWERGVGETLACGSGACAVYISARNSGRVSADGEVAIRLRGGVLLLSETADKHIHKVGASTISFTGEYIV